MDKSLIIRVDAGLDTGMGHLMRELDLVELLEKKGIKSIIVSQAPKEAEKIFSKRNFNSSKFLRFLKLTNDKFLFFLKNKRTDGVLLDLLYGDDDPIFLNKLSKFNIPLFSVTDDAYPRYFNGDIQFCFNPNQNKKFYKSESLFRYFGLKYFMANPCYEKKKNPKREYNKIIQKILVVFGSFKNVTPWIRIREAIDLIKSDIKEIVFVASGINPDIANLESGKIRILKNISQEQIADQMNEADLFIGSMGNCGYEACIMGLPVIAINQAGRQNENAVFLTASEACLNLGVYTDVPSVSIALAVDALSHDVKRRERMGVNASRLVDGKGLKRVADIIAKKIYEKRN